MLSDEEKKAIKKVKYICDKWYDENLEIDVKWLGSLLSLCEKQSKEIEKLKKPKYIINFKTNEITKLTNDFVSKDKLIELREIDNIDLIQCKLRKLLEE